MSDTLDPIEPQLRWLIRRDVDQVMGIEGACFDRPLSEEDVLKRLRSRNTIGMVAEAEDEILGYMMYSLHGHLIDLTKIAVAPWHQRTGVGRRLISRLKDKLSPTRRRKLTVTVDESLLGAQLFFRDMGFKAAVGSVTTEDGYPAYSMEWKLFEDTDNQWHPKNRIAGWVG